MEGCLAWQSLAVSSAKGSWSGFAVIGEGHAGEVIDGLFWHRFAQFEAQATV